MMRSARLIDWRFTLLLMCFVPGMSSTVHADDFSDCYDAAKQIKPSYENLQVCKKAGAAHWAADTRRAWAFTTLSWGFFKLGAWREVIQASDDAIRQKPDYKKIHVAYSNKAAALLRLDRPDEALASADKSIALKPDYHVGHNNRASALIDLDRHDEALVSADKTIALKPDYHVGHVNRAAALLYLGRPEEALLSADQAITLKPDYHYGYGKRAQALSLLGRPEEALVAAERSLSLKAENYWGIFAHATALNGLGRYQEALTVSNKAIRLKPNKWGAYTAKSWALNGLRRYEEALKFAAKSLEIKGIDFVSSFAYQEKSYALIQLGRHDEAAVAAKEAQRFNPKGIGIRRAIEPPVVAAKAQSEAKQMSKAPALQTLNEGFIVVRNANVRKGPNTTFDRVANLHAGDKVIAVGKIKNDNWYLISKDGATLGYIFGALIARFDGKEAITVHTPKLSKDGLVTQNKYAVAVIIGNRDYAERTPDVAFAGNDADAVRRFVIDHLGYREGNIIDLRDATLTDLNAAFGTASNHKGRLFDYVRAGQSDVIVFYSGHGVPGLKDRKGYLLPVDADPNRAELNGYSLDTLLANLAKIPARSMAVYLDACFSGESQTGTLVRATSGITVQAKIPGASKQMVVVTAARNDQFASWDEDAKHGLFTKHLLEGLQGRADGNGYGNGDGKVTLAELKSYLDEEMTYQARRRWSRDQNASIQGDMKTVLATQQ